MVLHVAIILYSIILSIIGDINFTEWLFVRQSDGKRAGLGLGLGLEWRSPRVRIGGLG